MTRLILTILCILVLLWTPWGLYLYSKDKKLIPPNIAITIICMIGFIALFFTDWS